MCTDAIKNNNEKIAKENLVYVGNDRYYDMKKLREKLAKTKKGDEFDGDTEHPSD